jgi:hypothetical protein
MWKLFVLGFLLWLANLEINPGIRRVWLRPDSQNNLRVNFGGIVAVVKATFTLPGMWKPTMWDANPVIMTLIPVCVVWLWQTLTNKILPLVLE